MKSSFVKMPQAMVTTRAARATMCEAMACSGSVTHSTTQHTMMAAMRFSLADMGPRSSCWMTPLAAAWSAGAAAPFPRRGAYKSMMAA